MSPGACAPRPFGYTTPPSVIGCPSPALASPLLVSRSTGPQPLVDWNGRSLPYASPCGAGGGTGAVWGPTTRWAAGVPGADRRTSHGGWLLAAVTVQCAVAD